MSQLICTQCGAELRPEEVCHVGEEIVCRSCAETDTVICSYCGERIWNEQDAGSSEMSLCESCCDSHYTRCVRCGELIALSSACYQADDDEESSPYCEECFREFGEAIHCYSYKPVPVFHGDGPMYMGVELEVDEGGKDSGNARKILSVLNQNAEYGYIKSDGSLDDGLELVTYPCTPEVHLQEVPWKEVLEKIRALGYFSHQCSTCGLHVHVNRSFFGSSFEQQEERIGHVLYLFERFWQELLRFSRRIQRQVEQWAARYGYKDTGREILEHAKKSHQGRYTCVNLTNSNTIEFRIFRGTLKYNTLIATLQFVEKLCSVAISLSEGQLQSLSWSDLMLGISEKQYPELVQYLKERRLYVNEVVNAEGEV